LIEIAMHGWNHTEYPTGGEFKGRPFEDQLYYILEGKRLLDHVFSNATGPVVTFTVTYNLYDENTVKAAKQAGFKIFSSKLKQHWWDNGVTPPTRHNNFHEGLLFLDWNFYLIKDETTFELHAANEVLETCRLRTALYGVCVIMFHVQELAMNWQDRVDLDKLRKFEAILDSLLGAGEFEFMTMGSYYLRRLAAANT
ncbi:MAG: hypothetical protein RMH74_06555, partial [Candidatus Caldarchaeum sp.]|nr:hypothetical protein [Candidatus Caldarchaeum sp.]